MPGNILCVTSNFPRWEGDNTTPFVLNLARDLQQLGWGITVLAPHAPGCATKETMQGIKVERFRYLWPESMQTVCYQGGALINLRKNKANYLKLPALITAEFTGILRRLEKKSFDLLHTHWLLPQGFTGVLAAALSKIPHVATIHGGDVFSLQSNLLNNLKRYTLKHADYATVNSSATMEIVHQLAPNITHVKKIPMGASVPDQNTFNHACSLREKWLAGNGPLLIFVGRLVAEKGVEDLLEASALLLPDFPNIRTLIIGDGQDKFRFQKKSSALGLERHVFFTDWIKSEHVSAFLAAADIFIGPSRASKDGWQEAQGLTFAESMLVKTPVITTRTGGITDLVKHEETGLLVEQRQPVQIAAAVRRLVTEPELKAKVVGNGFHTVMSQYTRQASAQAFSDLFTQLLNKKAAR